MQKLSIKVSEQFFNKLSCSKLTPIRVTPLVGYHFKHHFIVTSTCESCFIINGAVTSANVGELHGEVKVSYDGEHEEIGEVVNNVFTNPIQFTAE
jgi:hypothetical protein